MSDPYFSSSYIPAPPDLLAPIIPAVVSISGWGILVGALIFIALLFLVLILLNVYFIYIPSRQLANDVNAIGTDTREIVCRIWAANQCSSSSARIVNLSFCPPIVCELPR